MAGDDAGLGSPNCRHRRERTHFHRNHQGPGTTLNLAQYIEWVVANAKKFEEVELKVAGTTDNELSAALVDEMIHAGLTRRA